MSALSVPSDAHSGRAPDHDGTSPSEGDSSSKRRGPFRPDAWLNVRQRRAIRTSVYMFRMMDNLAIIATTVIFVALVSPGNLLDASLAAAAPFIMAALMLSSMIKSTGAYQFTKDRDLGRHLGPILLVLAVSTVALWGVSWALGGIRAAHLLWPLTMAVLICGLHLLWRRMVARWRISGALTPSVVIVGATRNAERLIEEALDRRDLNVLGVFDDRLSRSPKAIHGVPVLGSTDDLVTHRLTPYVDIIVLAIDPRAQARIRQLTGQLSALPNQITMLVDPQGDEERSDALEKLARTPMASLQGAMDVDRREFNKRMQDIVIGGLMLLVAAPVMLAIAALVRLDSPGPAFFRQRRHGFNHEEIVVWKFRSMRQESADATASRQVTANDDRITRIGRILRATSLDELPQLFNVLSGEMSLVGPRPHAIGMKTGQIESSQLVAEYAHRHRIKPGMTGWAAIKGSRGPLHTAQDVRRRVRLDVDYIERQSFWLDMWIMLATAPVLLGDKMAVR